MTFPNGEFKSLRLCYRHLARDAAYYLYDAVWVYLDQTSLSKRAAIARHPVYSQMVVEVKFFPRLFNKEFEIRVGYENYIRTMKYTGRGRELLGFDGEGRCQLSAD